MKTRKNEKVFRVGISGSYGGLNLGDEAILQGIIEQLRRSLSVEISVFTKDPKDTLKRHEVERAIPVRALSRDEILPEIKRLDLFILGGGGILFDGEVKRYLREVILAHECGVSVMVYGVGAGPLHDPANQEMIKTTFAKAAIVTVRERAARRALEEAGVDREILLTADPGLLISPAPLTPETLRHEGLMGKRHLIGMSVREPGLAAPDINVDSYHSLLANAADYLVDRFDADIVFVPMERNVLDMQHSHAVISKMLWPQRATVLKNVYTAGQLLTIMKHFVFAVGMRLHFLIFAAIQEVPFVALPYASKVTGFLEELRIEMPPLQLVNSGRLIAYIDRSWDQRNTLKARIKRGLPALRERALETNRLAVQLLKKNYQEKS
ncbi:MAG TPA: polysaccharide pyruvyl transferase family protein [Thermodesulfobacteriota bacterium]|nr:polysaccharide pyruvyl transferase family protein [Thermodesulfobacteriota bacterium]